MATNITQTERPTLWGCLTRTRTWHWAGTWCRPRTGRSPAAAAAPAPAPPWTGSPLLSWGCGGSWWGGQLPGWRLPSLLLLWPPPSAPPADKSPFWPSSLGCYCLTRYFLGDIHSLFISGTDVQYDQALLIFANQCILLDWKVNGF